MSLNLNKVVLAGRITADVELKQTSTGISVASFSVAVNRRFQSKGADGQAQQADFINVTAWRQTAEFISKYFRKGSPICITGSIQTRSWTDQNGQKRYTTEIVADEAMFVESKSDGGAQGGYSPEAYSAPSFSTGADEAPKFEDVNTDDSFLPF